jgi:hypothetical protein
VRWRTGGLNYVPKIDPRATRIIIVALVSACGERAAA